MTRAEFCALRDAGDRRADEAVGDVLPEWSCDQAGIWTRAWTDYVGVERSLCALAVPPFATCPDDDPRSWPLFGEMIEARAAQIAQGVSSAFPFALVAALEEAVRLLVNEAATNALLLSRCAGEAELLLAARDKFKEES